MLKKERWTAHRHVAQGRPHRAIGVVPEQQKVVVGIQFFGEERIHTIPWEGTIYNNVDVRRKAFVPQHIRGSA